MFKHSYMMVALLVLLSLNLSGCNGHTDMQEFSTGDTWSVDVAESGSTEVPVEAEALPEASTVGSAGKTWNAIIDTVQSYTQDTDIPQGDTNDIVAAQGILGESEYVGIRDSSGWLLGADQEARILRLDKSTYNVEAYSPDGTVTTILENIMGDRSRVPECISWDGGDYIAWSESPNADDWTDGTSGADWAVFVANLQTGEMQLIAQDTGLRPREGSYFTYLAPTNIAIADGYISFLNFAEREDGEIVQAVMLYEIATSELQTLDFMAGDPYNHSMGWSSISGGRVAWSQAEILETGMYEGYTTIYSCETGEKQVIQTSENVIKPILTGDYLIGENKVNNTFYDGEIVAYSFEDNAWVYKITPAYYEASGSRGDSLSTVSAWNQYAVWSGCLIESVALLDVQNGLRYTLSDDLYELMDIAIYPGGLVIWGGYYEDDDGNLSTRSNYAILKSN
jgi:hypothetical protein